MSIPHTVCGGLCGVVSGRNAALLRLLLSLKFASCRQGHAKFDIIPDHLRALCQCNSTSVSQPAAPQLCHRAKKGAIG
jgi:hypothetical protein